MAPPPPPQDGLGKRPAPPLIAALDTDGDGTISADEIANAAASLKKLDKNGDGKLTPDEYHPPHPHGDGQQGGAPKPPKDGN
ncbi:MAG: EF-hand domain-containing protein [Chthoniobacter sp.]